ncbi:MAG TPA: GNAT family N-acetyltransferase [Candidatus Thermoplasmatota archaeon]|nr:GNAT family N-acetyltransferase [Candidatus Thermoplasmatota archaeon]
MVVQTGEEGPLASLARRLEASYYDLTALTSRHFGRRRDGWFLTGVAGLDAPTMNRAVVDDADPIEAARVVEEAEAYFGERDCAWSVVLSTFRPQARWHGELIARGLAPSTTLDVLARGPGPLPRAPPDPRVREAGADEVPLFTDILMDVFRMPRRFYPALVDMTEAWRRGGAKLYLAEVDGQAVGTTLLSRTDGVAGVYNVGTMRHARQRGLAKAMMARALDDAKGAEVVTLQVAPEGFAEAFYVGLGFEQIYSWRFYQPRPRGLFG